MQTDMFQNRTAASVVTLEIHGKIPSYKNNRMIVKPSLKLVMQALASGNLSNVRAALMAWVKKPVMLITKPEYQRTMEAMIASIESQLLSASQTACGQTFPASSTRSWIALSAPADDCWTKLPEIHIRAETCEPGKEGATVVIERI